MPAVSRREFLAASSATLTAAVLGAAPARAAGSSAAPAARLPRDNLLVWRDGANAVHPVRTPADWQKRRDEIVRGMLAVMGPLPGPDKRCPVDVKVDGETDCGGYVRRPITYQAEPGGRVPAYLCIPKTALAGKAIWDNMRALDVLESLPFVQRGGFGVIGHSLGGHNAVYTAVWDAIAAAASQVYRLHGVPGRLRVEHPDGPHEFSGDMRSVAYQLFDSVLMRPASSNAGSGFPGT